MKNMIKKPVVLTGRAQVVRDSQDRAIESIDTDMIFHNRYLHITDIEEMGQYTFDNLEGWENFPRNASKGDILVVGQNFGAGSSRQQAVDCFIALEIQAIIGESFGAIYKRNTINRGLPLMVADSIMFDNESVRTGDMLEIHLTTGKIINKTRNQEIPGGCKLTEVQLAIYQAGGLFEYASTLQL